MTKNYRHKIIGEIIRGNDISSQNMLLEVLTLKGFELTQATLSRDIKELKIVKAPSPTGEYTYQFSDSMPSFGEEVGAGSAFKFLSFEFSGQLAVAKTKPGYAMALAGEIDREATELILGTVAGDDTILLIPREDVSREDILEALANFMPHPLS